MAKPKRIAYSRVKLVPEIRVTLSAEGIERLCPRFPMVGTEISREHGLVTVREDSGVVADYHPDFIEPFQAVHRG